MLLLKPNTAANVLVNQFSTLHYYTAHPMKMICHIIFTGVYISKTSYIRQGEESLDGFYRAWHHVEYYRYMFDHNHWFLIVSRIYVTSKCWHCSHRYLRFFPDGHVIMLTTPDDPLSVIPRLRTRNTRYTFSFFSANSTRLDVATSKIIKIMLSDYSWFCFILQNGFCSARSFPSVTGDRQSNQSFCCCLQEKGGGENKFGAFVGWDKEERVSGHCTFFEALQIFFPTAASSEMRKYCI